MDGESVSVEDLLRVTALIKSDRLKKYDDYYGGRQPIAFLPLETKAQLGDRLPEMVLNVPRVAVGAIEERLDVEGFRLARNQEADETLLDIWQANDLDEWSQLCHIEALKHGIAFVTVWFNDADPRLPRIAVESAHQVAVEYEPGTRKVAAAAKRWNDVGDDGKPVTRAVLYLPTRIEFYRQAGAVSAGVTTLLSRWEPDGETLPNPLGEVPVVPFVNRPSLMDLSGESELRDLMPISDGINKLLSDMMVTSEYHAEGRRYATGIQVPREAQQNERIKDQVKKDWQDAATGKFLVAGPGVSFGQFAAADLQNFISAINMLLARAAFVSGLPPHMLGLAGDNPASADAIRSSESSLIRKAKRKQRGFGGSWERVMRLALKVRDGSVPDDARSMETIWANPETQTFAQDADAVTKLLGSAQPVLTVQAAREILRFTPTQIKRMDDDEARASAAAVTAPVQARIEQARALQAEDGLSQPAAYAAVGLLAAAGAMAGNAPAGALTAPVGPGGPSAP
jgi:hypothetical protein